MKHVICVNITFLSLTCCKRPHTNNLLQKWRRIENLRSRISLLWWNNLALNSIHAWGSFRESVHDVIHPTLLSSIFSPASVHRIVFAPPRRSFPVSFQSPPPAPVAHLHLRSFLFPLNMSTLHLFVCSSITYWHWGASRYDVRIRGGRGVMEKQM